MNKPLTASFFYFSSPKYYFGYFWYAGKEVAISGAGGCPADLCR